MIGGRSRGGRGREEGGFFYNLKGVYIIFFLDRGSVRFGVVFLCGFSCFKCVMDLGE